MVVAAAKQLSQVGDGLLVNLVVHRPAVAGFQDGHAGAAEVEQVHLHLLQNGQRQRRRPGIEVVNARRHGFPA